MKKKRKRRGGMYHNDTPVPKKGPNNKSQDQLKGKKKENWDSRYP